MTKTQPWWKTATGYQIYPRSFCDSNGDGIGDIPGITSKLDHLADLGIGFIWLSPVYASPMRDNGYDISDYRDIAPEFGTLADFDHMLAAAHQRDIRIVMDLVVNHCSSDHPWFQKACTTADCAEHAFFYWRDPDAQGGPPDDQRACFGGSAWQWIPAIGKYCYCHFGPQQPDLNWHNPALRREIYDMMNWWLDKGIGGFRMDVIDLIGKDIDGRIYAQGPQMHEFLHEMHDQCLAGRDVVTVGETWSATPETALGYCGATDGALDMVFNFNHIEAMWDPDKGRFGPNTFDLCTHKAILNDWQQALATDGWNSLYLTNHDLPRAVSHFANDTTHRVRSAKMLAMAHYLMKGTPYIYQGEEIGMTNATFTSLEQFRDIETLGQLTERLGSQTPDAAQLQDFLDSANQNGRDNARTPMQWNAQTQAGFTTGTPWIDVNDNFGDLNVAQDRADPDGVFAFYRKIIDLRRKQDIVVHGDFTLLMPDDPQVFAYQRTWQRQRLLVVCNVSDTRAMLGRDSLPSMQSAPVLRNTAAANGQGMPASLAAYEGLVWLEGDPGR